MIWVGLDVHKRYSRMGCFDPATGEIHDLGSVSNEPSALEEALDELPSPKTVVLEAGRSSYHMAGLLESMAEEVWIVDPGEVRRLQHTISKTDRRDAAALAWWAAAVSGGTIRSRSSQPSIDALNQYWRLMMITSMQMRRENSTCSEGVSISSRSTSDRCGPQPIPARTLAGST